MPPRRAFGGEGARGIVIARPGGTVQRDTDLLGATRLDAVSMEARELGIRPGDTIAAARAKGDALRVRVVAETLVEETLGRLAELGLAFGASTSFDIHTDMVWIDVTGCAHLYGGERPLAERLRARVTELGHACRIAIADGPRIAAAVARHAPIVRQGPFIVGAGKNAAAMRVLPVAALPLDEATVRWLRGLGMETVGDLQNLPSGALAGRLDERAADVMALIRGDDATPLTPYRPPPILAERVELEYGVESTGRTPGRRQVALRSNGGAPRGEGDGGLEGRARARARSRDALRGGGTERHGRRRDLVPLVKATDLFAVLRARIDSYSVSAPVLAMTLRVPEVGRIDPRALHLFEPLVTTDRTLSRLAADLSAELGSANVGVLELVDSWVPEERSTLVPYGKSAKATAPFVDEPPEPTRFLATPQKLASPPPKLTPGVLLDTVEWWRGDSECNRETAIAWVDGALAWIEIDEDSGETWLRGWVD